MKALAGPVLFLAVASGARAQEAISASTLTDEHVRRAIGAIVDELYARRDPQRFWEPASLPGGESNQPGGYTALTVLSLLYAGESYQDPRLAGAVDYLTQVGMDGTYARSLRDSVWAKLPPKFRPQLVTDTQWLLEGFSNVARGWTYRQEPNTTRRDNSITQYGALALWEAAKRDFRIEPRIWRMLEDRFLEMQLADGGWNYTGDGPATGSMTAAGLATLFITQDYLHAEESVQIMPGRALDYETAIARGLDWMNQNFDPTDNPGSFSDYYYYMYGVERVGLASGRKFFGPHDWYREGAVELINRLCQWDERSHTMTVHQKVGGNGRAGDVRVRYLTFALMFLSRGRVPVAFNKLEVDGYAWNNRPRDAANLTSWISDLAETPLNWQIVSFDAEPEAWLDAPVLYLASNNGLPWMDGVSIDVDRYAREMATFQRGRSDGTIPLDAPPPARPEIPALDKLQRYIELGGMVLAVSEDNSRAFTDTVQRAGRLMFPEYEWRRLPDDHAAYTLVSPVTTRRVPLMGLSNGVRELMILATGADLARAYQVRTGREDEDVFRTGANIYFYASEKNQPRPRLDRHFASTDRSAAGLPRVTIVRAMHGGNWNAEPMALEVFRTRMTDAARFDVRVSAHPLGSIDTVRPRPTLVMVSGTEEHDFTESERGAMKAYVDAGGTLLFETCGGRGGFTLSAEVMAIDVLGGTARSVLRTPIITGNDLPDGHDLSRLDYRPYSFDVFGGRETTPRLRGIRIDRRPRVLFSREDISNALLAQPCWGVSGYTAQSGQQLMENLLLYALSAPE